MIYVICPAYYKTGGTELLHQLVYHLNELNRQAVIVYSDCNMCDGKTINPAFRKYVNTCIEIKDIKDQEENIVVVSEIACKYLKNIKNAKKVIWWLSVDNFIRECGLIGRIRVSGLKRGILGTVRRLLKGKYKNIFQYVWLADLHLCQSFYAMDYIQTIGIEESKTKYLSDYLNEQYLNIIIDQDKKRDDIILYNPQKGLKFTKKIMKCNAQYEWIALKDLNNAQIAELMMRAKIYIDFGNHPGKDRMPREAAMAGCCIITGKCGSAANNKDVNILPKYKIEGNEIKEISNRIHEIMLNYKECSKDFDVYRNCIQNEKEKFIEDVIRVFC